MFDRKIILYIVIGFVAFALWNAWQKDYPTVKPNLSNVTTSTAATVTGGATPAFSPPAIAPSGEKPLPNKAPKNRLITVHTDVLDITIDTLGGNIIRANLLQYPEKLHQKEPVKILNDDPDYFYVTQSGLLSNQDVPTQFSAIQREYSLLPNQDSLKVDLSWVSPKGINVTKTFTFSKGKYDIAVDYVINNKSTQEWAGQFYSQIQSKNLSTKKSMFGFSTFTGASLSSQDKPYEKVSYSDMEKNTLSRDNQGGWVALQQRYFLSAWIPNQNKNYHYYTNYNNQIYTIGFTDKSVVVPAGEKLNLGAVLYVGPEITEYLKPLASSLDLTIDYGWLTVISMGFFWILKKIYQLVGNWGVAIILITLLIKAVFYKLSESSGRSMAKMKALAPKMQVLKERYGDDKQKMHQATMELYKKEKINPFSGCLPMLIQIPFFIALYYVLIGAVELRQAPFMLWLHDLSAPDQYYILPILMGLSMFVQQKMTPTSADPTQAKMMMLMPVIFTVFFLNFPTGLVLYWLVNNCLSVLQQWHINKKLEYESKQPTKIK